MALDLRQSLKLQQNLMMTPQLQMAIKLLAMNRMELQEAINNELVENPVLEESYDGEGEDFNPNPEDGADPKQKDPQEVSIGTVGDNQQGDNSKDIDWEAYAEQFSYLPASAGSGKDFAHSDLPGVDQTLTRAETLEEHLRWQIQMSDLNSLEREIAVRLIGELTNDGYLDVSNTSQVEPEKEAEKKPKAAAPAEKTGNKKRPTTLERLKQLQEEKSNSEPETEAPTSSIEQVNVASLAADDPVVIIAQEMESPVEWVEKIRLRIMREMDPIGCLARDLRECLLVQLDNWGYDNECLEYNIVDQHMTHVEKKQFKKITKALSVSMEDIGEALKLIERLEPRPGRNFLPMGTTAESQYITPDVYVHRVSGKYVVDCNDDGLPKLQISAFYRKQIKEALRGDPSKAYIRDKLKSAEWLIRSIHQRQKTIYRVMDCILEKQYEWFEGTGPLKPLVLKDVAEAIEMHESSISRVTTRKYVHTHRGVFELKYFFNSSISTAAGDSVASEAVKDEIKKLVSAEDPKKPLSDKAITESLADQGMIIARRTVAKYRELLGILPSSKRRQVF
ncbi:MAG: RNA polymerase sigma-54 factor [Myxococcales bacterium]|nr:RNA polymerase sigma-54 factor [Myxococcales bacterium]